MSRASLIPSFTKIQRGKEKRTRNINKALEYTWIMDADTDITKLRTL